VRLTPTEEDRLRIFSAAELARRTLARGLQLNAPEAIALACDEMHGAARGGASYEGVLQAGRVAVAPDQVLDGVADIAQEIRLEVLLDEGSRLVVVRAPFGPGSDDGPGATRSGEGDVPLAPERSLRSTAMPLAGSGWTCPPGIRCDGRRPRPATSTS